LPGNWQFMPELASSYRAPRLLRGGHVQTLLGALLPAAARPPFRPERLELPDGDCLQLGWWRGGHARLLVLCHGLEGSLQAVYIRSLAAASARAGWDILAWNYRGCGGLPNRLPRSYHSGESGDLRAVIDHAAPAYADVALVGFSLGGNLTLKYLGEAPAHPAVRAAVAVSAPVDLASSAMALDERPANRLYQRRFLRSLLAKAQAKARRFPQAVGRLDGIHTIRDFDERFTAPLHGFRDADDYYARASALPHLTALRVPALLLNALDDPLLASPSFPCDLASLSPHLHLEAPAHGGHVGFLDGRLRRWHEGRVLGFLEDGR
jgi:predicted alpha/beta-fold hydrolase